MTVSIRQPPIINTKQVVFLEPVTNLAGFEKNNPCCAHSITVVAAVLQQVRSFHRVKFFLLF